MRWRLDICSTFRQRGQRNGGLLVGLFSILSFWLTFLFYSSSNKTQSPSLARTIFDCFLPVLISPILPGLIRALAQVIQPLMVSATLSFIQSYSDEEAQPLPAYYGWSLAAAFLLVYLTFTASTSQYFYYVYRGAAVLRSAFVEMIYVKLLKMDVNAAKELGGANATNLMRLVVA